MGKRGRACRGDRRGVVHRGRGLANGLAAGVRRRGLSDRAPSRRGFRREKAPQIRRERFTAGSTETARRARRTARVDRETRVRGRVRGVSREHPPEPNRARSRREGLPWVPSDVGRFERHFSERARHVGTERYFFEQAGGVTDGARAGTGARGPARPRSPPSLIEDRLRASPLPAARSVARVPPRVPRVPRPRIFADRARPPLDRPDRRDRPPINPPRPDRLAGEISRRPLSETLLSCHARQFS